MAGAAEPRAASCGDGLWPEAAEIVIVGSGATGRLLAATLARGGKRVVILEAGPERTLQDPYSSQIWARRIKWGGPPERAHV